MDLGASKDEHLGSDLECSGSNREGNTENLSILTRNEGKGIWSLIWSSLISFGVSAKHECCLASCTSPLKFGGIDLVDEKVELLIVKKLGDENGDDPSEKNNVREKQKKNKKAPKPPRPPKGPSLDATDRILVQEITELAMKRRERIDRMKALKKLKAEKYPSFNSSMTALLITFLFLIVILFQGIRPRTNPMVHASLEPGSTGFISVQYFKNFSPFESSGPASSSINYAVRQISGSFPAEYVEKA